jgi:hypothetical protein
MSPEIRRMQDHSPIGWFGANMASHAVEIEDSVICVFLPVPSWTYRLLKTQRWDRPGVISGIPERFSSCSLINRLLASKIGLVVTEVGSDMLKTHAEIREDEVLLRMLKTRPEPFMPEAKDKPKASYA